MRKMLWIGVVLIIVSFAMWSKDPLNDVVSFIMSGSIPRTTIELNFWQTIGIVAIFSVLFFATAKGVQFEMLDHKATDIRAEKAKQDFKTDNDPEYSTSKNNAVSAKRASEIF